MNSFKKVEISSPVVSKLADLWGIYRDLEMALKLCAIAKKLGRDDENQGLAVDGLLSAALMKYMRCFKPGLRDGLALEDLEGDGGLSDDFLVVHKHFKNYRDKHLAHSVNHYENCYINADVRVVEGVLQPIEDLLPASERVILSNENGYALEQLIHQVINIVVVKRHAEYPIALDAVNALGADVIRKFEAHVPTKIDADKIHASRVKKKN